jgi:hypothetical protein
MLQHFLKNIETFSNARAGERIKRSLFRWALVGWNWKFASLSTFTMSPSSATARSWKYATLL